MLRWWCCSVGWASSSFLLLPLSNPSNSLSSLEGKPHPACPLVSPATQPPSIFMQIRKRFLFLWAQFGGLCKIKPEQLT